MWADSRKTKNYGSTSKSLFRHKLIIFKSFLKQNEFIEFQKIVNGTLQFHLKVALKRQQAVEDAIALRLASNELGKPLETLPPGKIFGMVQTDAVASDHSSPVDSKLTEKPEETKEPSVSSTSNFVSQNAIEMLSSLFPHRKRSVLELVLRRCDLDLLKAIEQCSKTPGQNSLPHIPSISSSSQNGEICSAFRPITTSSSSITNSSNLFSSPPLHEVSTDYRLSFKFESHSNDSLYLFRFPPFHPSQVSSIQNGCSRCQYR